MDVGFRTILSHKYKLAITAIIAWCNFVNGFSHNIIGPTLLDLKEITGSDVAQLSYGTTAASVVYCLGALICGWLYTVCDRQLVLTVLYVIVGIATILIPNIPTLASFIVNEVFFGFAAGGTDTALTVWLLEVWKEKSNPYNQAVNLCYSVGSFLVASVTQPFLSSGKNDTADTFQVSRLQDHKKSRVQIPYEISGAALLLTACLLIAFYFARKYKAPVQHQLLPQNDPGEEQEENDNEIERNAICDVNSTRSNYAVLTYNQYYWTLVIVGAVIICLMSGVMMNNLRYFTVFAVNSLKVPKPQAATMMTVMNAAYTGSFAVNVFLATKLKTETMIHVVLIMELIANILMWISVHNAQSWIIWTGIILLGSGSSSLSPSMFSFIEQRITVTNRLGSFFICVNSATLGLNSWLVGSLIETNPYIFIYWNFYSVIAILLTFTVFLFFDRA